MTTKKSVKYGQKIPEILKQERRSALAALKKAKKPILSSNAIELAFKNIANSDYITWGDNAFKTMKELGNDGYRYLYEAAGPYLVNAGLLRRVIETRRRRYKNIVGNLKKSPFV